MGQYRTSSLFHYIKKRNILIEILKNGFLPNYCKEQFTTKNENIIIGIPMVSFCDIPLSLSTQISENYGKFAIVMDKEWGIKKGLNPILYVSNESIMEKAQQQKDNYENVKVELMNGIVLMSDILDLLKKSDENKQERDKICLMYGFLKNYKGNSRDKNYCNYEENEWRYLVKESTNVKWFWNENEYVSWKGNKKPDPSAELQKQKLSFTINDIHYIVTKDEKSLLSVVKDIKKLKSVCGEKISEEDKELLKTKLISFERISKII